MRIFIPNTCVWTPTGVTFFFDGRVLYSVESSEFQTYGTRANIFINLQRAWGIDFTQDIFHYDIDYIKFGEFNSGDTNLPYMTTYENINRNLHENNPTAAAVSPSENSIAVSPSNANEIFYIGTNQRMNRAEKNASGDWIITEMTYNHSPNPSSVVYPQHDAVFHPAENMLLYVGMDDRLQYFRKDAASGNYHHWWIDDDWSDPAYQSRSEVNSSAGSIVGLPNGHIAYIGKDNKIHIYQYSHSVNNWLYSTPTVSYGYSNNPNDRSSQYALGSLVGDDDNNLYYIGFDYRVHKLVHNSGSYSHEYVDINYGNMGTIADDEPGVLTSDQNDGVFYISQDHKLHHFSYDTVNILYTHSIIPYNYASNNADKVYHNVVWSESTNTLTYRGGDGRMQAFHRDAAGTWHHWWTDNCWNTIEFSCAVPNGSNRTAPSITLNSGQVVYTSANKELRTFTYEACQPANPLNPIDGSVMVLRSTSYRPPIVEEKAPAKQSMLLHPNPTENVLFINLKYKEKGQTYTIYDINGKLHQQGTIVSDRTAVDCSKLHAGIYLVEVLTPTTTLRQKFVKQ